MPYKPAWRTKMVDFYISKAKHALNEDDLQLIIDQFPFNEVTEVEEETIRGLHRFYVMRLDFNER